MAATAPAESARPMALSVVPDPAGNVSKDAPQRISATKPIVMPTSSPLERAKSGSELPSSERREEVNVANENVTIAAERATATASTCHSACTNERALSAWRRTSGVRDCGQNSQISAAAHAANATHGKVEPLQLSTA